MDFLLYCKIHFFLFIALKLSSNMRYYKQIRSMKYLLLFGSGKRTIYENMTFNQLHGKTFFNK